MLSFSSECCLSSVNVVFLQWMLSFSSEYCLSLVNVVFLQWMLSFSSECCLSPVNVVFLQWMLSFFSECCLSPVNIVFLQWILSFSSECCLSPANVVFLQWMLSFSRQLPNEASLVELSIIAGNDFTAPFSQQLKERLGLRDRSHVTQIADWVREHGRLENHPGASELMVGVVCWRRFSSVECVHTHQNIRLYD